MEPCNNSERDWIRSLLNRTHPWPTWGQIDAARAHISGCSACQCEFPEADGVLDGMRHSFEYQVRLLIDEERKSYLAARPLASEICNESHPIAVLISAGDRIIDALWSVNTSSVPFVGFFPSLDLDYENENDEIPYARFGYFEFFSTLRDEEQSFVAAASTAYTLFPAVSAGLRHFATDPESRVDFSMVPDVRSLLCLLDYGASGLVRQYLHECRQYSRRYPKQITTKVPQNSLSEAAIERLRHELLAEFNDFSDSMKAGQMEVLRRVEKLEAIDDDVEPYIREVLGDALFFVLDGTTQQFLLQAEAEYRSRRIPANWTAAFFFAKAFENEFEIHLARPFVQHLLRNGVVGYPQEGTLKLIRNGRRNDHFTAGQIVYQLRNDPLAQRFVRSLGVDQNKLVSISDQVLGIRDKVVHQMHQPAWTEEIRNLMLRDSALRVFRPADIQQSAAQSA